ncbi:MAG TPA: RidA family protein [Kofleriaceae bacterium]|jgi:2-iminobutanoate/2-iminopropanoate deaminase|nr:RidA family protein [Kofleriaceae bacterium]
MNRSIVHTAHAPAAIGPYSQAIVVPVGDQRMVFCSGQIALDPKTGTIVEGDVAAQTRQVLDNLGSVLAAAGASFANVVKTTLFLADMGDFATVNAIYGERFSKDPPARSTVAVLGLPRNVRIEIEAIAVI